MIKVESLSKSFDKIKALHKISFSVDEGVIFAIVGPDGAGKTTLIRILAGIMTPDEGSIAILDTDMSDNPEKMKEHIGYLSQRFSLNPMLTVSENIDFFGDIFKVTSDEKNKRKERLLSFSRLKEFKDRKAIELSGGMKQKLALCCALIHTPKLLLLDEPTTGVDPISRRELWEILYDLLGEGVTIVISTPYMDEAERANQIMLMHEGKIMKKGSIDELRLDYNYDLYEIITEQNYNALKIIEKKIGFDKAFLLGEKIHVVLQKVDNIEELMVSIKNNNINLISCNPITPDLEDIFIQELAINESS